ncbi:o-succinylbenzoate--CoA ligase [Vibrio sp. SCSIO 43135]|uniref:o-succinylbenzoate--CoA ligase n=1 Tax=Vibrio sp. SCSIO 43135 TaxID=2819096 RepID=UPI00207595C1|nr:o-succinylbenzoate--CoA ligase [Vibrio sp. SCSIO 43135]USD42003.1 o-succinylbenzoate--CoA ligase [Vibrio sp. SCSIO 43135]
MKGMSVNQQHALWKKWAQQSPLSSALLYNGQSYHWMQLSELINAAVHQLKAHGVKSGNVVTLVGKNHVETVVLYLACLEVGAICAITMPQPLESLFSKLTTLYPESAKRFVWLSPSAGFDDQSIDAIKQSCVMVAYRWCEKASEESKFEPSTSELEVSHYNEHNPASVIFTSGSTGSPKAVMHTSAQHLASARGLLEQFHFRHTDTWLLSLPLYHVSGLAIIYRWLQAGGCLKVGNGSLSQDIQDVSHASLVATQLKRLLDSGQPLTLTHVLLGGSHIPLTLSQQAQSMGIETWLGYGMTEAASTVTAKKVDGTSTAGALLNNRKLKLEQQRIFIGGETLASGYYVRGELLPIVDNEGWFDSKDLGEWLGSELRIIGRADNQFISGGENVHCEEVEAALNQFPLVSQSVVIPVQDAEFGQRSVAFLQSSVDLTVSEMEAHLSSKLEKFKWPVQFYPIPPEAVGSGIKISRHSLKQWLNTNTLFKAC